MAKIAEHDKNCQINDKSRKSLKMTKIIKNDENRRKLPKIAKMPKMTNFLWLFKYLLGYYNG